MLRPGPSIAAGPITPLLPVTDGMDDPAPRTPWQPSGDFERHIASPPTPAHGCAGRTAEHGSPARAKGPPKSRMHKCNRGALPCSDTASQQEDVSTRARESAQPHRQRLTGDSIHEGSGGASRTDGKPVIRLVSQGSPMQTWPIQDAKARFSEFLETCLAQGPQMVTKRGSEAAVLVPVDEWRRLQAAARPSLKQLLLSEEGRCHLIVPARGRARRRAPIAAR